MGETCKETRSKGRHITDYNNKVRKRPGEIDIVFTLCSNFILILTTSYLICSILLSAFCKELKFEKLINICVTLVFQYIPCRCVVYSYDFVKYNLFNIINLQTKLNRNYLCILFTSKDQVLLLTPYYFWPVNYVCAFISIQYYKLMNCSKVRRIRHCAMLCALIYVTFSTSTCHNCSHTRVLFCIIFNNFKSFLSVINLLKLDCITLSTPYYVIYLDLIICRTNGFD